MKVSEKLKKVDESFQIYMYDNGFMVEVGGRTDDDEWATAKIMCPSFDDVVKVIEEIPTLPRS